VFKVGIYRVQCFLHGSWLTPMEAGYSRAIPLRFLPAFPPKAKPAHVPPQREWEAGLPFLRWVRQDLPDRTVLAVRTTRNRRLYYLPEKHGGRGRPASYGPLAPHPSDWLHKGISWQKREVTVRGKSILMKFQVLGSFVREGLPEVPLFFLL
jgi:hypothetical protein